MLAGDWDYLLVLATRDVTHCREVADRLFGDQDYIKRYETRMVFEVVKQGLQLPTRDGGGDRLPLRHPTPTGISRQGGTCPSIASPHTTDDHA